MPQCGSTAYPRYYPDRMPENTDTPRPSPKGEWGANFGPREESGTACVSLLSAHPHEALGSTQRNETYYQSDSGGDPQREDSEHLSLPSSHRTRRSSRVRRPPWGTATQGILYTTRCRNSRVFNLNAVIAGRKAAESHLLRAENFRHDIRRAGMGGGLVPGGVRYHIR